MITRDTIEDVKNRIDIVDVISDFITLKKSGANYKALSPFANEKTPSFFVVPAKGIFKDFSSGKGGDAFSFVMEHEKLSYAEAIRYLAKKYGVEIKEDKLSDEGKAEQSEREGLYILMNFAKEYYKNILHSHDEGKGIGLSYFRERGFTDRTIEKFELGFALEGWEHFSKEAIAKGYNKELLEKTGLVVKKEDNPDGTIRTYDRFRGRVIFPVHNISGKVIAFGARMMGKEKNQPKYINSPETDIYHKSDVLYGLYQGKNAIRQQDVCYLVEGYTDVISMHQSDVENVVASSGTALTENQIKLIHRFTENVTVLFDGDSAGIKAALRGIDMILKGGLNVRVVLFPDGEDPDSYSRKVGTTEFQKFLKANQRDFVSFKIDIISKDVDNDPIKQGQAVIEIVTSLASIPDEGKRSPYYELAAKKLGVKAEVIIGETNKIRVKAEKNLSKEAYQEEFKNLPKELIDDRIFVTTDSQIYFQERETIRLLLNYANNQLENQKLSDFILHELDDVVFKNVTFNKIYSVFKEGIANGEILDNQFFLRNDDNDVKRVVTDLITPRYETSQHWGDKFHIYFSKEADILNEMALTNVLRLKFRVVQKMMEDNLQLVKQAELSDDLDLLDKSLETQTGLKKAETELAGLLGIVVAK
ncbi:MAG: DNA primase [Cytophagales bacterium]|nr:DNA primase [Cytophagales bacterium]MCA6366518.1 DNA primase [Cytophagales bacterium]MCA6376858.1 DNA primase [Cytophagales bacterium]MCA6383860.1 DNA primase [Cytophagales bacterium]